MRMEEENKMKLGKYLSAAIEFVLAGTIIAIGFAAMNLFVWMFAIVGAGLLIFLGIDILIGD